MKYLILLTVLMMNVAYAQPIDNKPTPISTQTDESLEKSLDKSLDIKFHEYLNTKVSPSHQMSYDMLVVGFNLYADEYAENNNGDLPRMALNDDMREIIFRLSNDKQHLPQQVTQQNMPELMDICASAVRVMHRYQFHGLKQLKSQPQLSGKLKALALNNMVRYQQELGYLIPFQQKCMVKQVKALEGFFAGLPAEEKTPVRLEGIKKMQQGAYVFYMGGLSTLDNKQFSDNFKQKILKTMADNAKENFRMLPKAMRADIDSLAKVAKQSHSHYAHELNTISEQATQLPCDNFCKVF